MENWDIIGHQHIVKSLKQSLKQKRLPQAYLFYGPANVGKTTLAEIFANELIKSEATDGNTWREFYPLKCLEGKQEIGIDQVRQWCGSLTLKSFNDHYKIGIIYEAERLNQASANALLKTIEEPQGKVVIILITSNRQRLLPTIISRSASVKFLPVPQVDLLNELKIRFSKINIDDLSQIIAAAGGRPGLALKFLNEPDFYNNFKEEKWLFQSLLQVPPSKQFKLIEQIFADKESAKNLKLEAGLGILDQAENYFRRELLADNGVLARLPGGLAKIETNNFAITSNNQFIKIFELINQAREQLRHNVHARLVLENFFLNLT